uniref:Trimethylguanosine synthase n=2 Tax=Kalanchoe fedtschenkoi TaxID=63787 RepID=A0A7N0TR40_KALFE
MEAPVMNPINSLVKFSEVFLRDEVMDESEEAASRRNKKKYFHSDDEDFDASEGDELQKVDSVDNGIRPVLEEEAELSHQMKAMGLPVSFTSSKKNTDRAHGGSRKSTQLKFSQNYECYAEAMAGTCRVSTVNTDPQHTYLEVEELMESTSTIMCEDTKGFVSKVNASCLTDDYPVLTECSVKNKKKTMSNDDPGTVLSTPTASAIIVDGQKDLDEEEHGFVEASSTSDHSGDVVHSSNCVEQLLVACNSSSDVLEDVEMYDFNCYGEFEDWRMYWDNESHQYYYYNMNTTESTWEPPPGMELHSSGSTVISGEHVVDECVSSTDNKLMDEDELLDHTTGSFDEAPNSAGGHKHVCRLPATNAMSKNAFDINQCPDCQALSEKLLEKYTQESGARKQRKTKKSRVRRTSSGDVTKYWCQRYYLFSKFDDGIKMDEEGWYSVTPEQVAKHHASRCGTGVVLDLFTGVGGNAIQFAQRSQLVIAIDIDPSKIAYAQHNAAIYGVSSRIEFIQGNSFEIAPTLKADTVFLSPPWGGPDYAKSEVYDLKTMLRPHDGYYLFNAVKHIAPHIVMFLPRNVDVGQLIELAVTSMPPWSLEVEKNFLNGKLKAVTAYFKATGGAL